MKYVLQENTNSLIDYDAEFYRYRDGYRTMIAYIHGLYTNNPDIEMSEHIVDSQTIKFLISAVDKIREN